MKQQIFPDNVTEFLKGNRLAVVATVSQQNTPEAALLYYGLDEEFHIYCCTYKKSRKFLNIESNNKIALVIGQEVNALTLQLEGSARIITDKVEKAEAMETYAKKATENENLIYFPPLLALTKDSSMEFLQITIEWFKFSTFESHFPNIIEGKPNDWKEYPIT